jgi:cell volume regulation protein A
MDIANQLIFLGALIFLLAILASAGASRIGAPLLLVFLLIGMLAGEEGPGGIRFDDVRLSYIVGNIALAVILFDGGLQTPAASFRAGLRPALSLATVGVLITAGITGAFAAWLLDLSLLQGLLVGAIVGSTDAAAVFSLLHSRGMQLNQRVGATLEIESGSNDPMAVFLTVALIEVLLAGGGLAWSLSWLFVQQMGLGLAAGLGGGWALAWLINRLRLAPGLYPMLALAGGLFIFALTAVSGGSGFLAIYVAGLVVGNRRVHHGQDILRVNHGIAWLGQIVMFLVLGLLVTPSQVLHDAPVALGIALMLMLVARPVAVWLSLLPFRLSRKEVLFIAWVGLRGAVPIVLALFPLLAGLPHARLFFDVAFFVVLVSLVLQGWTVAPLARRLGLELPPSGEPVTRLELDPGPRSGHELVAFRVEERSEAAGAPTADLALGRETRLAALVRDGVLEPAAAERTLRVGDVLYLFARPEDLDGLARLFRAEPPRPLLSERAFFGDFVLGGEARLSEVCEFYGLQPPAGVEDAALADVFARRFVGRPVVGDRLQLSGVELVVREIKGGRISRVGLLIRAGG